MVFEVKCVLGGEARGWAFIYLSWVSVEELTAFFVGINGVSVKRGGRNARVACM